MATNTIKTSQKEEKKTIFRMIESKVRLEKVFQDGIPVKYVPYILYMAGVLIFYIGITHHAQRTVRRIEKMKGEVNDLRADYTTLKADLMFSSKQSEVAKKVAPLNLEESIQPPYKIEVKKGEY